MGMSVSSTTFFLLQMYSLFCSFSPFTRALVSTGLVLDDRSSRLCVLNYITFFSQSRSPVRGPFFFPDLLLRLFRFSRI